MKNVKYFLFSLLCIFTSSIVFAKDEIVIKSMVPVYDENSTVVVSEDNSVVFNDKDQLVEYKVVLENTTDKDLIVEDINLTTPTEDFLIYKLDGLKSKDILKANSTKEVVVSLETIKKDGWGRNFNDDLIATINFDVPVMNPNTSTMGILVILIFILFLTGLLVIFTENRKLSRYVVLIVMFGSVIGVTNAKESLTLSIKVNAGYESKTIMKKSVCLDMGSDGVECHGDYYDLADKIWGIYIENDLNELNEFYYKYDISEESNGTVMAYLVENEEGFYLYIQGNGLIYLNEYSLGLFSNMKNLEFINNIDGLDTSKVTDMSKMFMMTGTYVDELTLDLSGFDTSNVTNVSGMFWKTCERCSNFTLDVSGFDTSNVVNMSYMFYSAGLNSDNFTLDVSNFDTSNVTNMENMFNNAGYNSKIFTLDVSKFDTSNVTNMNKMFNGSGFQNPSFTLDVSHFDTSKVTDMSSMFYGVGYSNPNFTLDVSNFDTSNVTDMDWMFFYTGYNSTVFTLDVSNFDTSNVTDMNHMFYRAGFYSTQFTIDVSNFNTSKVKNMARMFDSAGYSNPNFTLNVSGFDTSNVTDMEYMFYNTGYNSNKLDVSIIIRNPNVTSYANMFRNTAILAGSKITVNYTSETSSLVDKMITTKNSGANVVKGVQVD